MTDSIDHIFGEMLPSDMQKEKSSKMQHIEFMSEIDTTPFEPAVSSEILVFPCLIHLFQIVPIHRSAIGHYEFMGDRYETLYDLVHHLASHRSALPHKLVYCRSSPLVVGRNVVPPPTRKFKKDLHCQPMIIEQWAASHFDGITRRFECSEKTLFTTKTIFDSNKKHHEKVANRLNLSAEEKEHISAYLKKFDVPENGKQKVQLKLDSFENFDVSES